MIPSIFLWTTGDSGKFSHWHNTIEIFLDILLPGTEINRGGHVLAEKEHRPHRWHTSLCLSRLDSQTAERIVCLLLECVGAL